MDAPLAVTVQDLQYLLQDVAFTRHYGFRLQEVTAGTCALYVPFQEALERPGGIVGGHAFMVAADAAMWLALLARLGLQDRSVTIDMTTAFLQGAKQEDFVCRARILRLGKRLVYGVAECTNVHGVLLTYHTMTYARPAA